MTTSTSSLFPVSANTKCQVIFQNCLSQLSDDTQESMEDLKMEVYFSLKQTDQLNQQLKKDKQKIVELETEAREIVNSFKMFQLLERIKFLKKERHQLRTEANNLREQNELLEFRINELEVTDDCGSFY